MRRALTGLNHILSVTAIHQMLIYGVVSRQSNTAQVMYSTIVHEAQHKLVFEHTVDTIGPQPHAIAATLFIHIYMVGIFRALRFQELIHPRT